MLIQSNIKACSCNHCCSGKAISIIYSECVSVALCIWCPCSILSSVAWPAVKYFSTLSHKLHDLRKKNVTLYKTCLLIFSTNFVSNILILTRTGRDKIKNVRWSSCKMCYSCQILMQLGFSKQIFEKYSNVKCHENPFSVSRVVACGRTDRHDEFDVFLTVHHSVDLFQLPT